MKTVKRILLLFLHTASTLGVQYFLFALLMGGEELSTGAAVGYRLLAVTVCIADLVGSFFLLKGNDLNHYAYLALQFWDLLLLSPMFLVAILSLLSGSEGAHFGIAALLLDLLLILERSTSYVLFDPRRRAEKS